MANNWADYGGAPAVVRMFAPDRRDKDAFFDDPRCIRAQTDLIARLKESYNAQLSNSIAVQITLQRSRLKRSIVVNHLDAIPLRFD